MTPRLAFAALALVVALAAAGVAAKAAYNAGYWSAYYEMRNKLDAANRRFSEQAAASAEAIRRRDLELKTLTDQIKAAEDARDGAITEAQSKIPLSDACTVCRVPAARIHGGVRP